MRILVRMIGLAATLLLLGGCVSSGSLTARGTSIDESVGTVSNRAILLNLARAAQGEPLYFVSINNVQAQGTSDLRLSAPGFIYGNGLTFVQRQLTFGSSGSSYLDNTINTNFQMGVFNTQAFYEGMLQPLGLNDIDLLLNQGYSREMIFYLVIEKAKITPCPLQGAEPCILYNDPANKSYPLFVGAIEAAMEHGLTTEVPVNTPSDSGAVPVAAGPPPQVIGQGGKVGDIDFVIKPADKPAQAQLCFERALSTVAAKAQFDELTKENKPPFYCGSGHKRTNTVLTVRLFDNKDYQIVVTTRSIYAIFNYLGGVMNVPTAQQPVLVDYNVPSETTPAGPLLTVTDAGRLGGCFTWARYGGRDYCVPQDGAKTTKQVFNVLSALVALKQSPGDLPASQTVVVAP